jgi:hypothetical protein
VSISKKGDKTVRESYSENVPRHIEERGLLTASQFGFRARHGTTLQCMRLTDSMTLNSNNNMSTATVFYDTGNAVDRTWNLGLLCTLSDLKFSISLMKLNSSSFSQVNFRVSVEAEMHAPILRPVPNVVHINVTPQTLGGYPGLFADDSCIYATDRKEDYIPRKLQRGLSVIETRCERLCIKISENKTQTFYFFHKLRSLRLILQ